MAFIQRVVHDILTQPIHPIFVHFPIALCVTALFFIVLALWLKKDIYEQMGFANISLAAVSTLVAGFWGIRDNLVFYKGGAPNHVLKIVIASILFVITAAIALARWRKPDLLHSKNKGLYITGYSICFVLVFVLGFLGGVIVYGF